MTAIKFILIVLNFVLIFCNGGEFDNDMSKFSIFNKGGSYKDIKNILQKFQGKSFGPTSKDQVLPDLSQYGFLDDDSELSKNVKFLDDVFQGDIILSMEQAKILLESMTEKLNSFINIPRNKRKIISDKKGLWPTNVISYGFDSSITTKKRGFILAGIKHWEDNTCLKFRENKNGDYMLFVSGAGCYSTVGRIGGKQEVSLGDGCELLGIVAHEIGHVLGFWHEHSRPDRDRYIKINLANVIKLQEANFNRLPQSYVNDYGIAYDLGSALHYGAKAYSSSILKRTIDTVDPNFITTLGQRKSLSFIDIKQMNFVYCSNPSGDGRRCDNCRCPDGFAGKICNTVEPSKDGCSTELKASTTWQNINFNGVDKKCNWLIKAPDRLKIRFKMLSVNMTCKETCKSFVEIKYKDNFEQTGSRHCCELPQAPIVSMTSELLVLYRVDADSKPSSGFSGQYKIESDSADETQPDKLQSTDKQPSTDKQLWPNKGPKATYIPPSSQSQWEEWSACSEKCGGCGSRVRRKRCPNMPTKYCIDKSSCNEQVCQNKDTVCSYPVNVPCRKQNKNVLSTKLNDEDLWTLKNPPDYVSGGEIKIGSEIEDQQNPRIKRDKPLPVRGTQSSAGSYKSTGLHPSSQVKIQTGNQSGPRTSSVTSSSAGSPSSKGTSGFLVKTITQMSTGPQSSSGSKISSKPTNTSPTSSSSQSSPVKKCTRYLQYSCNQNSQWKVNDAGSGPCCKGYQQRGSVCSQRQD